MTGQDVNFGYVFGICVEKNSEQTADRRKFKGRVVFQGNRVVNLFWEQAQFEDMGSAPATLEASRAADAYGCFEGNDVQAADAEQAYIQAELKGTETWVALPEDQWPPHWHGKYHRPVVKLKKALLWSSRCGDLLGGALRESGTCGRLQPCR
jgi:hypothetical protein